jgi:nitrite reductase/ring-hydroxylating ferredoxin subunit
MTIDTMSDTLRLDLCGIDEVAPGAVIRVEAGGLALAVYNADGEFFVTDDACTHGPGQLSEGFLDGYTIECNFHQGLFDIRTGAVVQPPCIVPVKTYKASVEGGRIYIDI